MDFVFTSASPQTPDFLCVPVFEGKELPHDLPLEADKVALIEQTLRRHKFSGKSGELLPLYSTKPALLLMGAGSPEEMTGPSCSTWGAKVLSFLENTNAQEPVIYMPTTQQTPLANGHGVAEFALGMRLRAYNFNKYKTQIKEDEKPQIKKVTFWTNEAKAAEKIFEELADVAAGIELNRDLLNEAPNVLTPLGFAEEVDHLRHLGIKVTVLERKKLESLGMGCLLGVGQGSINEPCVILMEWEGGHKGDAPIAFVGKGVTFDTGGISIKPSSKMDEMKFDMGGAACVAATLKTIALRKLPINVVGAVGMAENMPGHNAYKPGDILTSMSGQTVEVLNTDAEGRLVLADVLWYTQATYKPLLMIDLATLTGAIIISLGHEYAGLFANDDRIANQLLEAGNKVDEKVWRLPLSSKFDKAINSKIADVKNTGPGYAGSSMAAQFLQRFVNKTPWAHLDIAGVSMFDGGTDSPLSRHAASGYGVRLLYQFLKDNYVDVPR